MNLELKEISVTQATGHALVSHIKHEIEIGEGEAASAAQPHFERAGLGLINALMEKDSMNADQFWNWASDTFGRSKKLLRSFMEMAFEFNEITDKNAGVYASLGDLLRAKNKLYRSQGRNAENTYSATKATINEATAIPGVTAKPVGSRAGQKDEQSLRLELALKIIDIGFQALAVKMHPDKKTGSEEAMKRLNIVRDKSKTAIRRYFK